MPHQLAAHFQPENFPRLIRNIYVRISPYYSYLFYPQITYPPLHACLHMRTTEPLRRTFIVFFLFYFLFLFLFFIFYWLFFIFRYVCFTCLPFVNMTVDM